MKATELRIGNLAIDTTEGFAGRKNRTIEVSHEVIYSIACGNDYWKPVPLTEEWLERFGFEQMKLYTGDNCFVKEKFCVLCDGQLKNYDLRLTFDSDQTIRVELDYVHQLQNLYFALTGEELQTDETDQKVN